MRTELISVSSTSPANSHRRWRYWRPIGAKTKGIEIGTAVIDMRYENSLYMAEDAMLTVALRHWDKRVLSTLRKRSLPRDGPKKKH